MLVAAALALAACVVGGRDPASRWPAPWPWPPRRSTVLLAGALDASSVRPAQVVLAAGLLMALLSALAAARGGPGGRRARSR